MIRQPVAAGTFYPASADELRKTIQFLVDAGSVKEEVYGMICPHAGYVYSGAVAGAVLSRVALSNTIIILGPNHTGLGEPFSVWTEGAWQTPLGEVEIDAVLAGALLTASSHLKADTLAHMREHAIEVQLPFLQYLKPGAKIVPVTLAHAGIEVYNQIGQTLAEVIQASGTKCVILASSDMTHYESDISARHKDKMAVESILKLDEYELAARIARNGISMCGYAPVAVLIAAARAMGASAGELVHYQTSAEASGDYSAVVGYAGIIIKPNPPAHSPLVELARRAVESYAGGGGAIQPPDELSAGMNERAGVFVSLHKGGELRGCIGTFAPSRRNVAEEIIANAINASMNDPRFEPVMLDELADLEISVDVLTRPEPVADTSQLDPKKYGCIVERGWKRGLLLPDLEGVVTPEQQVEICRRKADIGPDESVKLYRFEVKRYH
jgi:hypothetical protein